MLYSELLKQADAIEPRLIRSRNPVAPTADPREEMGPRGFAFLRRDLVRIIGLLAFEDKAMQDLVRERGGVEAVLSLSAMDDRNPCAFVSDDNSNPTPSVDPFCRY